MARPANRPSITELWPKQRKRLTIHLDPTDIIFFRNVDSKGYPSGVGTGNAGKYCTVIIGHKEIEGIQKLREFRGVEEFTGSSVSINPDDQVFTCRVDSWGVPSSVGIPNKGKDVTIILHLRLQAAEKGKEMEDTIEEV